MTLSGPAPRTNNGPGVATVAFGATERLATPVRTQARQDAALRLLVRALARQAARSEMARAIASNSTSSMAGENDEDPA